MHRLRGLGIDIHAARNAALHDLTKELTGLTSRPPRLLHPSHEHPRCPRRSPHGHLPRHPPPNSTHPKKLNSTLLDNTDIQ
jgi:hypothetical protein